MHLSIKSIYPHIHSSQKKLNNAKRKTYVSNNKRNDYHKWQLSFVNNISTLAFTNQHQLSHINDFRFRVLT